VSGWIRLKLKISFMVKRPGFLESVVRPAGLEPATNPL
jgi:hypothetical protein